MRGTSSGTKLFFAGFGLLLICGAALGVGLSLGLFSGTPSESTRASKPSGGSGEKAKASDPGDPIPPIEFPPKGKEPSKIDFPLKPGPTGKPPAPAPDELRAQAEADYQRGQASTTGKAPDFAKAREWWEKAAEQGHSNAQNDLGTLYHKGEGGPPDFTKAREWYEKAAAQGNANAQNNLGLVYEHGLDVPKDVGTALDWYRKAAANGSEAAKTALARLEKSK